MEKLVRPRTKQVSKLSLVLSRSLFLSFSHVQEERLKSLELANSHSKKKKKQRELQHDNIVATRIAMSQRYSHAQRHNVVTIGIAVPQQHV